MNTQTKPYRSNVGVLLFNNDNHVFVGQRSDTPNAWQMPQGGIDEGEDYIEAAYRELFEETGVKREYAEVLEVMDDFVFYDFPETLKGRKIYEDYRGQKQKWVAMRFLGSDEHIDLEAYEEEIEFSEWKWVALDDTVNMIIPFKKDVYVQLIDYFSKRYC